MAINSVNNYTTPAPQIASYSKKAETKENTSQKTANESGVVYEKSSDTAAKSTGSTSNSAIISKLKADAEQRTSQMRSLVEKMMSQQGSTIGKADSMWRFLADGNFTVDAATKAQAQADIAEDGYWGVEQTSDRILDFAKALAGNDSSKADELLEAFKKGYQQATGTWGKELPDISSRTYDAVVKKFDDWKNGTTTEAVDPSQA